METIDEPTKRYIKQLEAQNKAFYEALATPYMNKVDPQIVVQTPRGFTLIKDDKLAALEAVAKAAKKARAELIRPLRHGETVLESAYRAKEILRSALDAPKAGR